jgi:Fic family protein
MDLDAFSASPVGSLTPIRGMDSRFGVAYDHMAFVPDPLPKALGRLDQASQQIPNPELLRQPTLRREAQSTSALEGTFAPLSDVLTARAGDEPARSKELLEVMNYVDAANHSFDHIAVYSRLTVGLLQDAHAILVSGTDSETSDAGNFRTTQVAVGSQNGSVEDARFVPMPPGINLEASMRDLTDWISGRPQSEGIIAAAMAHYQFETLHPFNDGNGRLGRLLIVLQLCMMGDLREPLLSVSPWFEARREAYQEHLANVSKMGDWDSWIKFFATGVEESAIDVAQRVDRILDVQKAYQGIALAEKVSGLARDIIDFLPGFPVITAPYVTRTTGKTTQAAGLALKRLVGLGILKGPYGSYEKRYIATDIWAALVAPVGHVPVPGDPLASTQS